ncbi:FAD-dependent oxidoreductase [Streptomyces sp. NRRL F-5727]|uniref:FAD-dependent oxidoreductase n=1 Tax=Streptomyces sp. NRRL F-5727 TaxID=1463871 RepID=UPI00068D5AC5|nr:FAD-dependent oxidoreductase [Streptomyces sp. NRRL F-5727]
MDYDHDVDAVGSTAGTPPSVPGAAEFAVPLVEFEVAERLRATLDVVPRDAPVTVVGGGLTGIERAAEPAEGNARSRWCAGASWPPRSARAVAAASPRAWLFRHGVAVLEGVSVSEVWQDEVVLDDGSGGGPADGAVRPSALSIWAGGVRRTRSAAVGGLRTEPLRSLLTDGTLTASSRPAIPSCRRADRCG